MKGLIAGLSAGGAIGFFAGWFICKKKMTDEIQARADEEIAQMKLYYKEKEKELVKKENQELEKEAEEKIKKFTKPSPKELLNKYHDVAKQYESQEGEDDDVNYIPPKLVSYEVFDENEEEYDVEELLYFQDSDTLTSEDESLISDPEHLVGTTLTKYDFKSNDETDVYIVNENLSTYYHVHKVFDEWEG